MMAGIEQAGQHEQGNCLKAKARGRTAPSQAPYPTLQAYCPGLLEWPQHWRIEQRALLPGNDLLDLFTPFHEHLRAHSGLARKTQRRHRDSIWALGGTLIERLHDEPALRQNRIRDVLLEVLDDNEGSPLLHPLSKADQRSANAFLLVTSDQNH